MKDRDVRPAAKRRAPPSGAVSRRMRRRPPVDEERHDAVADDRRRIGEAPGQLDAVGSSAAALRRAARARCLPVWRAAANASMSGAARGPRHQPRLAQRVDTEPSRSIRRRLIGIGPDNLEIGARTQRHERIPGSAARMLSARRRLRRQATGRCESRRPPDRASHTRDGRRSQAFPHDPRRHAARVLDDGRLQRIDQLAAERARPARAASPDRRGSAPSHPATSAGGRQCARRASPCRCRTPAGRRTARLA